MGFFKSIGDFFSGLIKSITQAIRSLLESLGPLLPLVIIAAFVFAPYIGASLTAAGWLTLGSIFTTVGAAIGAFGTYALLAVGVGVAAILAPEETAEMVSAVTEVVGDIVTSVAEIAGDALSTVAGASGFTSLLLYGALGLGAYLLLKQENKAEQGVTK